MLDDSVIKARVEHVEDDGMLQRVPFRVVFHKVPSLHRQHLTNTLCHHLFRGKMSVADRFRVVPIRTRWFTQRLAILESRKVFNYEIFYLNEVFVFLIENLANKAVKKLFCSADIGFPRHCGRR